MRASGCRGSRVSGAAGTYGSVSKDSGLAPKDLLSAKVAQGDRGASSFFLVGRCLPANVVLLVPELCGKESGKPRGMVRGR